MENKYALGTTLETPYEAALAQVKEALKHDPASVSWKIPKREEESIPKQRQSVVHYLVASYKLVAVVIGLAVMIALSAVPSAAMGSSASSRHLPVQASEISSQQARSPGDAIQQSRYIGNGSATPVGTTDHAKHGVTPRMTRASTQRMSGMQTMQCMSEMQSMMASMGPTRHMSMQAMTTMMTSMHLPRHATHLQCMGAMHTMMARMHPMRQTLGMRTIQRMYRYPTRCT